MSKEYIGAIVILLISILKLLKIELGNGEATAIVTGLVALYVAYRRHRKGDITVLGSKK